MAHARRSFRGFGQGARRKTGWETGPGGARQQIAASGSVILGLGSVSGADGITLVRLRGSLMLKLSAADAETAGFVGAFGIGIVKAPAFAIGVTAVPTPVTEQDDEEWIFWYPISVLGSGTGEAAVQRIDIDTKAMRKLTVGDTLYGVVELTEAGVSVLETYFDSRMLIMLP